ncbi:MAG TPA: sugar ABC transporter ATP-binding protein, partial [Sphingomonas sp.]
DAETGFGIPGDAVTGDLPLHLQQQVEILRALARRARLIVMDEPTASLGPKEAERLHAVMAGLKARGCAIVYVTHFLDHVLTHCDHVTVLRDGRVVESRPLAGLDRAGLIERMLGRVFTATFPPLAPVAEDAPLLLDARNIAAAKPLRDGTVTVRRGEIVGLLGLVGSGRTELLRALAGIDARTAGTVAFDGAFLPAMRRRAAKDRGLVMVPEDRRGQGLLMDGCVRENMTLPYLHRFARLGLLARRRERAAVAPFMARFGIVPSDPELNIRGHSGGNQQKVLLARWLMDSPRLIMLDEPTRGVDVGARERIYAAIAEMARNGMGVLLVSSDLEEVLGLSHRAYLFRDGRTVREIDPADWTSDDVLRALFAAGDSDLEREE